MTIIFLRQIQPKCSDPIHLVMFSTHVLTILSLTSLPAITPSCSRARRSLPTLNRLSTFLWTRTRTLRRSISMAGQRGAKDQSSRLTGTGASFLTPASTSSIGTFWFGHIIKTSRQFQRKLIPKQIAKEEAAEHWVIQYFHLYYSQYYRYLNLTHDYFKQWRNNCFGEKTSVKTLWALKWTKYMIP